MFYYDKSVLNTQLCHFQAFYQLSQSGSGSEQCGPNDGFHQYSVDTLSTHKKGNFNFHLLPPTLFVAAVVVVVADESSLHRVRLWLGHRDGSGVGHGGHRGCW